MDRHFVRALGARITDRFRVKSCRTRRTLFGEFLESRALLSASGVGNEPAIVGTVFVDVDDNGELTAGEEVSGVEIRLIQDDGDGIFETNGQDVQIQNVNTDGNGEYCFDDLDPDVSYFVYQPEQTVGGDSFNQQVSPLTDAAAPDLVIDMFETQHSVSADPPAPSMNTDFRTGIPASEVIGSERDLLADLETGASSLKIEVSPFASNTVQVLTGAGGTGAGTITWDGLDGGANSVNMGLGGVDLTNGGKYSGIVMRIGADQVGAVLTMRIFQGSSSNVSESSFPILPTGGGSGTGFVVLPFSDFSGSVSATNVDAIQMEIDVLTAATDTEISLVGAIGKKVIDFLNQPEADLAVTKDDSVAVVRPGQGVTYTINVTNSGPNAVLGAQVKDDFPSELQNVSFTSIATNGATGNTPNGAGNIDDTVNMPVGSSIVYTAMGTVASNATGQLVNSATVTAPDHVLEINVENNVDIDSDEIDVVTDLSITKTDNQSSVQPSEQITYTIVVTNAGPADVINAQVSDTFPATLQNVSYTSTTTGSVSGNTSSGANNIADLVNMTVGSTITYTVNANVTSSATGQISNTASVQPPEGVTDLETENNTAVDVDLVISVADLSITKTDGVITVDPGDPLTYTIVARNEGPGDVNGVQVFDSFPEGLQNVTFTSVAAGGATNNTASGTGNISDTVNMPANSSITYTVNAVVAPTALGTIENTALIIGPDSLNDENQENNSATDIDSVVPVVDLRVTKDDGVTEVVPGESVSYTIVVSNSGPSTAINATFTDNFPSTLQNIRFTSVASEGASGNSAGGVGNLTETLTLPPGSSVTYTVNADVDPSARGTLVNTATVTPPNGVTESNTEDNTATDTDTLTPEADLVVTKDDGVTTVVPGTSVSYTVTIRNNGPSSVDGATLTDVFPVELENTSFTSLASGGANGNSLSGSGNLNESLNLPASGQVVYTVTGTVSPDARGLLVNSAQASVPTGVTELNSSNNTATDTDELTPQADLGITKSNGEGVVTIGTETTYTITVTNNGPSDALLATVTDVFPSILENVTFSSTAEGGASNNTSFGTGNINDTVNLPVGSSITYSATGTLAETATGSLSNSAIVSAPDNTIDPNLQNNTANDTDQVRIGTAEVNGRVFFDINENGTQDSGEPGISGVTLRLVPENSGAATMTTVTNSSGDYQFLDVERGDYKLIEDSPAAYRNGTMIVGDPSLGSIAGVDEFFLQLGSGDVASNFSFTELRAAISKRDLLSSAFRNFD